MIHAGVSWRWVWPGIAVWGLGVGVWALVTDPGTALQSGGRRRRGRTSRTDIRCGACAGTACLFLLAVFALAEITEGGVDTWGVLYLRNHLATGVLLGAGAYIVGQVVAATTRGAGGHLLGRLSTRRALITGGCVAGAGILLESLTSVSGVAALGLALGAGGASLFWPLVMSTVSRMASQAAAARSVPSPRRATSAGLPGPPSSDGSRRTSGPLAGSRSWPWASFGVAACHPAEPERSRSGMEASG